MFTSVATKNPDAVEAAASEAYLAMFPQGDRQFIPRIFGWARDVFQGRLADYQPIDVCYHDFEHTLQGTLCMVRLLRCRHAAAVSPALPQRLAELGLIAILFHDTGYLKKRDDLSGTGAKYTATHVNRSTELAAHFLAEQKISPGEIASVQNMIRCTGADATLAAIQFQSDAEKITGHILGTADLLGQMAADDYVEKLPLLHAEFAESASFSKQKSNFPTAKELMQNTPAFWEGYIKRKLDRGFSGQFRYFNQPYPDGPNWYLDKIDANIRRLRQQLAGDAGR